MQDETLNNILNLLQNNNPQNTTQQNVNPPQNNNLDLQSLLIKLLLSGGLNNLFNQQPKLTEPIPEQPRTINLENYQRLD